MPTPNPFLQFVPNRAEAALRRLSSALWYDRKALPVSATFPTSTHRSLDEARPDTRGAVTPGSYWGRLFDQRWFHIDLPRTPQGLGPVYLEWRDQGEATLHVDGMPYYGFDVAHRYVALPPGTKEVWIEGYCCQSAIWHPEAAELSPKGCLHSGAFLVRRDEVVWNVSHDLRTLFDVMLELRSRGIPTPPAELQRFGQQPSVEQTTPLYRQLLSLLDRALDAFDSDGVLALKAKLEEAAKELRDSRAKLRAVLTGHAHIDLVWLWPERMGEAKAVHTFSTVNRLLSLYPEFRFAYSQPASYRAVARRSPRLAAAVQGQIVRGAWEPTGALEVESDTQLPCGEALARSFLLGQSEFRRLRGSPSRLLWLPDVFGYSACLPQLMKLAGVDWFFTTKLTWSAVNRFPYSSFVWRGNDGSEVVAHVTQNVGYNNRLDVGELEANARGHSQSHLHSEFLHPTGYGDGGGGPTEEMCERARRLGGLAGLPAVRWEHPEAFFARLARRRSLLPVYQGECYLEYHRGTYTTHADLKAAFRSLERSLQVREAVAAATGESPDLQGVWRRLVFAQFHDFIPGSSIAEVYAEGVPELSRHAREQQAGAKKRLEQARGPLQAFNPHALPWAGWLELPGRKEPRWVVLPPLSSVSLATRQPAPPPVVARGRSLDNGRVRAELSPDGTLKTLSFDGHAIAFDGAAALPVLYPDRPANYDAWDVDRHSLALGRPVETPVSVRKESAPEGAAFVVERALGGSSALRLRYELRAGECFLRLTAEVDWREREMLLKLHFPTAYRGRNARFGAPFGSVLRVQQPGEPQAEAQWEVPGSRWATVSDDGEREGLAVATEAKYGFAARDGDLSLSLLRSARITGCDDPRYGIPKGLSRHVVDSPFSDQGRHVISLALGRFAHGMPREEHPAALADTVFTIPLVYQGQAVSAGLTSLLDAPTLLPAWVQPLGTRAWLLRLHEVGGARGSAQLCLAPGWTAHLCSFEGKPQKKVSGVLTYTPYQILSVRIERSAH